jgi:outer membrane protein assembly factor BamE (lipoprotein component of BamABCDE complex)
MIYLAARIAQPAALQGKRFLNMVGRLLPVCIFLSFLGCEIVRSGEPITPQRVSFIQKGVTVRDEVIRRLGPPLVEFPARVEQHGEMTSPVSPDAGMTESTASSARAAQLSRSVAAYYAAESTWSLFTGYESTAQWLAVTFDDRGIVQDTREEVPPRPEPIWWPCSGVLGC